MLAENVTELPHKNVRYFLMDINGMIRNDLWSNVKSNFTFFVGKNTYEFRLK